MTAAPAFRPLGQTVVAEALRVFDVASLQGRRPEVLRAKRAVVMVLRGQGWTYSRIGRLIGIDHGTCMHHYRQARATLETDAELRVGLRHLVGLLLL